ncbi:hypothetical protein ACHAWF_005234 [Thalassiosira exigua]
MVEHAFYQGVNAWQALYLHAMTWAGGGDTMRRTAAGRAGLLWLATAPWLGRGRFPLHSFSANWTGRENGAGNLKHSEVEVVQVGTEANDDGQAFVNIAYRVKKWQYVFYKHVVLHGLNISVAFPRNPSSTSYDTVGPHPLPATFEWRAFWSCVLVHEACPVILRDGSVQLGLERSVHYGLLMEDLGETQMIVVDVASLGSG